MSELGSRLGKNLKQICLLLHGEFPMEVPNYIPEILELSVIL